MIQYIGCILFWLGTPFLFYFIVRYSRRPHVTQEWRSGPEYATYAWYKGDIVWAISDPIERVTEKLKKERKREAENVLGEIKHHDNA